MGWGESGLNSWGRLKGGPRSFILVLRERIGNKPTVSLVLPAFDVIGSLGSPYLA